MRRLILQPPRTCNCFHLVLAKFCIFGTCIFFAFPSGDWQREIGCAEAKVRTCHFQCPDNYWPNAKKAVPLHSHSALESHSRYRSTKSAGDQGLCSPHSSIALWGPQERRIARSSHVHRVTIAHTYTCSPQAHMVFPADASRVLKL